MEIYKQNIGVFLNILLIGMVILHNPAWLLIEAYLPFSFIIPLATGAWMGIMERDIDWELI